MLILAGRADFSLPILWLTKVNPTYECNFLDKKCKKADFFVTKTGHFGLLYSINFRPFKIGKSWIASGVRLCNDVNPFRPNVLLKGSKMLKQPCIQAHNSRKLECSLCKVQHDSTFIFF